MATKFGDVLKAARDLLDKPFKYENKIEVKSASKSGVTFTTEAVVSKPSSIVIKAEAASGNFKLDKLQVGSDKKVVLETTYTEAFPGTKLTFKAQDGSRGAHVHHEKPAAEASKASAAPTAPKSKKPDTGIKAVIGIESKQPYGVLTADVDALALAATLTATAEVSGAIFGGSVKLGGLAESPSVDAYDVLVGYKAKDITFALQSDSKLKNLTAGVYQELSPELKYAAVAHFPVPLTAAPDADSGKHEAGFTVDAALAYKLDASSTFTGKVNHKGTFGLSYVTQLSPVAKLGFATEIHGAEIAGDKHTFGISLNITA